MPSCRRDQTKFAVFLALLVTVEVVSIVTFMHFEHRRASTRSRGYDQELQLAAPRRGGEPWGGARAVGARAVGARAVGAQAVGAHTGRGGSNQSVLLAVLHHKGRGNKGTRR